MTQRERDLRHLYERVRSSFFILVHSNGSVVVQEHDELEVSLRLFMSLEEAQHYKEFSPSAPDIRVFKTTVEGVWAMIPKLERVTKERFGKPLRVDVCSFDDGALYVVDNLRGIREQELAS